MESNIKLIKALMTLYYLKHYIKQQLKKFDIKNYLGNNMDIKGKVYYKATVYNDVIELPSSWDAGRR